LTSVLDTRSVGARPKMIAVATQIPARKTMTIGSMVNVIKYGLRRYG
jgi:hypothetical protein